MHTEVWVDWLLPNGASLFLCVGFLFDVSKGISYSTSRKRGKAVEKRMESIKKYLLHERYPQKPIERAKIVITLRSTLDNVELKKHKPVTPDLVTGIRKSI